MSRAHLFSKSTATLTAAVLALGLGAGWGRGAQAERRGKVPLSQSGSVRQGPPVKYTRDQVIKRFFKKHPLDDRPYLGQLDLLQEARATLEAPAGRRNILMLADAGDGKTSFVDELARQMPDYNFYSIDPDALMAGADSYGEIQARYSSAMAALESEKTVGVLDEVQRLKALGGFVESLKVPLNNNGVAVIAMTTPDEYRESGLEANRPLARRFRRMRLPPAEYYDIVTQLRALKFSGVEEKFKVRTSMEAIKAIARAVIELFPNEPPRSIAEDLYMSLLAQKRSEREYGPRDVQIKRSLLQAKELELKEFQDELIYNPVATDKKTGKEIVTPERKFALAGIKRVTEEMKALNREINVILAASDIRNLPALRDQYTKRVLELGEIRQKRTMTEDEADEFFYTQNHLLPDVVKRMEAAEIPNVLPRATEYDVGALVAKRRGVSADIVTANAYQKVERMRDALSRVVGQRHMKARILRMTQLEATALKPIVGFAGLMHIDGGQGLGKTELAEAVAYGRLGTKQKLITISFSEFGEHSGMRWSGSGPGLVGSEKGGIWEPVRQEGHAVVNGDELDKTNRENVDRFHRLADKGISKDANGQVIDVRDTVLITTGNYTGDYSYYKDDTTDNRLIEKDLKLRANALGDLPPGQQRDDLVLEYRMRMVNMSPSMMTRFRNRGVVDKLFPEDAKEIVKILADQLVEKIKERRQWDVHLGAGVTDFVALQRFRWMDGGRYLGDAVTDFLELPLSDIVMNVDHANTPSKENPFPRRIELGAGTEVFITLEDARTQTGEVIIGKKQLYFRLHTPHDEFAVVPPDIESRVFRSPAYPPHDPGPPPRLTEEMVANKEKAEAAAPAPKATDTKAVRKAAPAEAAALPEAKVDDGQYELHLPEPVKVPAEAAPATETEKGSCESYVDPAGGK